MRHPIDGVLRGRMKLLERLMRAETAADDRAETLAVFDAAAALGDLDGYLRAVNLLHSLRENMDSTLARSLLEGVIGVVEKVEDKRVKERAGAIHGGNPPQGLHPG